MHFKLPYYATLIIPGLLYGIFTSSIMGGFIVFILQFVLAPLIFREWFTFKVWDDYQRTNDEDDKHLEATSALGSLGLKPKPAH